ncbi:hypothetical protein [Ramlibacter sp. WS9]|uniref:hypothetical protein n=1 Tax=Ramlibacter sp. WS9 TaxID=1882741 RepID=UPI001E44D805|nr:hypothetical protein [Ramlibacter sp. WS9]
MLHCLGGGQVGLRAGLSLQGFTTLAFLLSARALSLLWRERDLVCSMRTFSTSWATRPLMYFEPLSE